MTSPKPATAHELTEQAAALAEAAPPVEPPAKDVIEALRRVMRDLPAIGKDQTASPQQGGYSYRGIEQITVHTQRLFARHGVVFVPHVRSWEIRELVVNGKPWTDTILSVEYTVHGPGDSGDWITVGPLLAIGRDNSDKGANKAMTQALKYAMLQTLSISDSKDDADGITHEADARAEPGFVWDAKAVQFALVNLLDGNREEARKAWEFASGDALTEWSQEAAEGIHAAWVAHKDAEAAQEAPAGPEDTPASETPTEPSEAHSEPHSDRVEAVIDWVGQLGRERLAVELVARGLDKVGNVPALRQRLGAALLADESWEPPQQALV